MMSRFSALKLIFFSVFIQCLHAQELDYLTYHRQVMSAEKLISSENFIGALKVYNELFSDFDFVFLRDYKIATQLALFLNNNELSFEFLRRGASAGWEMKEIRKTRSLKKLQELPEWQDFENEYPGLYADYESSLNSELRSRVRKMFSKDQKKALGALFRIGSKSQDKYGEEKFAPHSEQQMKQLVEILSEFGYPGEKLIGNDYWASTILSHHNSISQGYASQDTIYPSLKPALEKALKQGEISPFELALIDEWYRSTLAQGPYMGYGILDPPTKSTLQNTNELRAEVFLRSVETRNGLVDIQDKTQMDFYLPGKGWIDGKIEVTPN
jgi:hypothetical protein